MPGKEYICGDCGHRFGTPEGEAINVRNLMCPSCGSIDLSIVRAEHAAPIVMRAVEPAMTGSSWPKSGAGTS